MPPCGLRAGQKCLVPDSGDKDNFKAVCLRCTRAFNPVLIFLSLSPSPRQWLRNPGPQHEKRTLFGDMVCFLFITPLATISGWLCLRGAVDHLHFSSRLEAVGLIALTVALFTIYLFWTLVSMARGPGVRPAGAGRPMVGTAFLLVCSTSHLPSRRQTFKCWLERVIGLSG